MHRYRLPRLHDVLFIAVFVGGLVLGARMLNTDSDLGRHLTLGGYILRTGQIPIQDILSYTKAGASRPPYEWLSQVLLAVAYRLLDLDGVVLLTSLAIAAAFSVVYLDARQRSGTPLLALFVTAWAAAASSLHWLTRPHVFSFLLFALWLAMLDRVRRKEPQPLWQFPLLMLIWVNMHGGFLFGFLAYAAYAAGWLLKARGRALNGWTGRRLLTVGISSLAATIITPDLWHNWDAVLANRSAYVLSRTAETMPLNPAVPNTWAFLLLFALSVLLMLFRRREVTAAHVILLLGLAGMSFLMARNVPFFVIAASPLCSLWLGGIVQRLQIWGRFEDRVGAIERTLGGFVWSALAVVVATGSLAYHHGQTQSAFFGLSPRAFPVAAVDWLQTNPPQGRMFNDFNWGGYLLLRTWPGQRVFIDSQSDFYGEQFIREYAGILDGNPGWEAQLRRYDVSWMIVPPSSRLAVQAGDSASWRVAYRDAESVILVRR